MTEEQAKFLNDLHGWKVEENEDVKLIESTINCRTDRNFQGFPVHYFQYQQKDPKAILFILHGLTNCSDLKAPVANVFKKANFEVFAFDQIGHGKTFGGKDLCIADFNEFHQTSWSFINGVMKENPSLEGLPVYLIGESMGGAIILEMMLNKPFFHPEITGILLMAAAIDVTEKPSSFVFNALYFLSNVIQSFPVSYEDVTKNTRIVAEQQRKLKHPNTFKGGLPASTGREMVLMSNHLMENLDKIDTPMLIVHGTHDFIVRLEGSQNLYDKSISKDKTLLVIKDGYHSILSDYSAQEAIETSLSWCIERREPICQICSIKQKDLKEGDFVHFGCRHYFCSNCLSKFIDEKFLEKNESFILLNCPYNRNKMMKCKKLCSHDLFLKYASKESLKKHEVLIKTVPKELKEKYDLSDFNYEYNEEQKLRNIDTGDPFYFINQSHYNALGDAITNYIQDQMKEKYKLEEYFVDTKKTNNIFLSKDALTNENKLLVIIQGSGAVRPGQWARSLCINDSLHTGACLDYIEQAISEGYAVMVLNPNLVLTPKNKIDLTKRDTFLKSEVELLKVEMEPIEHSSSSAEHVIYCYDEFISKSKAKNICIVAHSAGGSAAISLLSNRHDMLLKRLKAIGFTDSVHFAHQELSTDVKEFLKNSARNWIKSNKPLDTKYNFREGAGCLEVSAGHTRHENTSSSCQISLFKFLNEKLE
eukprot:gene1721-490_t